MILVDTTLRGSDSSPVARLRNVLMDGEAALAPVILQEVLQGASSPENLAKLKTHFSSLPMLLPHHPTQTYLAAAELYARCRWSGVTPRSPHDCLIAQVAIEHDAPLLHDDSDFESIARIQPMLKLIRA